VKRLSAYPEKVWAEKLGAFWEGGGVLSPHVSMGFGEVTGAGGEDKRGIGTSQFLTL
jgi:hypothetical protein